MDVIESMDREVIVERAEAVRLWLLGMPLSSRATGAIQRELGAIIADDPGGYIDGQRPLAGLTVAAFVSELHRPNGGAVGRVKRVSEAVLNELRAAIRATTGGYRPQAAPAAAQAAPAAAQALAGPPAEPAHVAPISAGQPAPEAPKPRRGRPRKLAAPPAPDAPKPRRGRPRKLAAPPTAAALAAASSTAATITAQAAREPAPPPAVNYVAPEAGDRNDPVLSQILRLWPSLHPHARRAVVIYASTLWVETVHEV
jgi:hypothetical protein